jgi:hypothetical protein
MRGVLVPWAKPSPGVTGADPILAFLGVIAAPVSIVHHTRGADEPRQAHRAAAADEDAAAAFRSA